jgi:hypothetical protein
MAKKLRSTQCDSFSKVCKILNGLIEEITDLQFEVAKIGMAQQASASVAKPKQVTPKSKGD